MRGKDGTTPRHSMHVRIVRLFSVYILASRSGVLYVGVTNDLVRRLAQHREPGGDSFTHRYHVTRLVYYETTENAYAAISREKELKTRSRKTKIALVESQNPCWDELHVF